jgi:hypothetical protein
VTGKEREIGCKTAFLRLIARHDTRHKNMTSVIFK